MDRFIDGIELVAAIFVGLVAADTFLIVVLRYFFNVAIPDSYDSVSYTHLTLPTILRV